MGSTSSIEEKILLSEYREELAEKTVKIGKLTFLIGIPILILFAAQDILIFETQQYIFWRMVAFIPMTIFGLMAFTVFRKNKSQVFTVYFVVMLGIVSMMGGVIYTTFISTGTNIDTDLLKSGTTTGFVYAMFAAFAFSGNTRKYMWVIVGLPIVLMTVGLYFSGEVADGDWGYLSNVIPIGVIVILMSRMQEKMAYGEFRMRKMLEFRENELEEEVVRRRLVEEELVEHQDHLEKLVAQRTLELQRTNEELVISKEKAEEMNLLKSHFLNNMGHEIRTPINGILGIAQVLEFETDMDEIQSYSVILKESGERLYRTLTGILNLSKLEAERTEIDRESMDVLPIIEEEMESHLSKANEKGLELKFDVSDMPKVAFIEEEMFRQVLYFLLENAIKFTQSGGVTVSCRNEDAEMGIGRVCVQITDTGIGMDQTFMDKLFEPFSQESNGQGRAYEGTGLGLTLVQKFTHLLGGEIRVESEKGAGTTFEILLPEKMPEVVASH